MSRCHDTNNVCLSDVQQVTTLVDMGEVRMFAPKWAHEELVEVSVVCSVGVGVVAGDLRFRVLRELRSDVHDPKVVRNDILIAAAELSTAQTDGVSAFGDFTIRGIDQFELVNGSSVTLSSIQITFRVASQPTTNATNAGRC